LARKSGREGLGPAFNRLWSASLASNVSDGLFKTAVPLLAASLTHDPFIISLLAAMVMLPWLLFAIPIGGLVDRVDRRLALATANAARFVLAAALALSVGTDTVNIPVLYLIAFLMGIAEVAYDTTAQSLIPQMLKPEHLERGNSRLEIGAVTTGEFIGAPLSGVLYASAIALPFLWGSLGIGVATVLLFMIPGRFTKDINAATEIVAEPKLGYWADIRFGIKYLYDDKTLLKLVLFTSFVGFWFAATGSTYVLFLLKVIKVDPTYFGLMLSIPAIGSIIGSILVARVSERFGRVNVMAIAIFVSGALTFSTGFVSDIIGLAVVSILNAITITFWNVLLMSTYHQIIPNHLFGRIHGTRRTLVWGMMPIGSAVGGLLALIDLRAPFLIAGGVCALAALIGIPFVRSLSKLLPAKTE
jgi:MFS family permease